MELDKKDITALSAHIQNVCNLDDENAFILLLRFGFGVECNIIRRLISTHKGINGICEAFRFGCQRFFETPKAISDKSMLIAFQLALQDYEIFFVHNKRGTCWMRQTNISIDIDATSLRQILYYARCRSFIQLEDAPPAYRAFINLNTWQSKKLAQYILDLPIEFGSILLLHYYRNLNPRDIKLQCNTRYAKGSPLWKPRAGKTAFAVFFYTKKTA